MRRRSSSGTIVLALGAILIPSAIRADDATSVDAQLQEGVKLSQACVEPKPEWPEAKLSSNFDTCNDGVQAFVKAMEASKDPKTVEAATSSLALLNVRLAATSLRIGRYYAAKDEQNPALAFLRVACTSFDAVSAFGKLTPEQAARMKDGAAEADRLLQGYHTSCKAVLTPDN